MNKTVSVDVEQLKTWHRIIADYDDMYCHKTSCPKRIYVLDKNIPTQLLCERHRSTEKAKKELFDLIEGVQ